MGTNQKIALIVREKHRGRTELLSFEIDKGGLILGFDAHILPISLEKRYQIPTRSGETVTWYHGTAAGHPGPSNIVLIVNCGLNPPEFEISISQDDLAEVSHAFLISHHQQDRLLQIFDRSMLTAIPVDDPEQRMFA